LQAESEARLSEQRKQLEAIAAAQAAKETALHEREEVLKDREAQRKLTRKLTRNRDLVLLAMCFLLLLLGLAGGAFFLRSQLVEAQRRITDDILTKATNIIANLQNQMDFDTQKEAFAVYQAGAKSGDTVSLRNLGLAYQNGFGVEQDYAKAREWYERAAANSDVPAMNNLGQLYQNGQGVAQDYAKAREWFEKAAAMGDADAKMALERLSAGAPSAPR
jgi:TPR repeat protein